jgi:hypothetical protein
LIESGARRLRATTEAGEIQRRREGPQLVIDKETKLGRGGRCQSDRSGFPDRSEWEGDVAARIAGQCQDDVAPRVVDGYLALDDPSWTQ